MLYSHATKKTTNHKPTKHNNNWLVHLAFGALICLLMVASDDYRRHQQEQDLIDRSECIRQP